jgi:ATP-dependent DNA ligase
MTVSELTALLKKLRPLGSDKMIVDVPPPRATRFGTPLVLSRAHWVRPELVAEVTYLTWTPTGCCAASSMKGCARTSRRVTCAAQAEPTAQISS